MLFHTLIDQRQVLKHLPDGHDILVSKNDATETESVLLSSVSFGEKVLVERNEHPPDFGRTVQQFRIRRFAVLIILRSDDIDTADLQLCEYRPSTWTSK